MSHKAELRTESSSCEMNLNPSTHLAKTHLSVRYNCRDLNKRLCNCTKCSANADFTELGVLFSGSEVRLRPV